MEVRKIREDERKEYHRLSEYAFGEWKDKEIEDDKIRWMNYEHCLVLVEEDKMVSGLINHHLKQSVRGVCKYMSGIGNVATYPEYRNKGYVKKLFKATFEDCRENEMSVSVLQPFKESFYQKFGYVSTNREIIFRFNVDSILHYLKAKQQPGWSVERGKNARMQAEYVKFISEQALKYNGMVIYDELYDGWKEHLFKDDLILLIKKDGEIKAACRYVKKDLKIRINDAYWTDFESRKLFFNFFAKHRDQVGNFDIPISMGANFYRWFLDSRKEFEVKMCDGPWMVRVVDMVKAFEDIPAKVDGKLTIAVTDEMCNWNNGLYRFIAANGRLTVTKLNSSESADFAADIRGMSSLLYGAEEIEELLDKGWLKAINKEKLELIRGLFPQEIFFNSFWF